MKLLLRAVVRVNCHFCYNLYHFHWFWQHAFCNWSTLRLSVNLTKNFAWPKKILAGVKMRLSWANRNSWTSRKVSHTRKIISICRLF